MPPGYPWATGDVLLAADLNAAFANAGMPAGGTMTGPLAITTTLDVDTGIFGGVANFAQRNAGLDGSNTTTWVGPDMLYYDLYSFAPIYPPPGRPIGIAAAVRATDNPSTTGNTANIAVAAYNVSNGSGTYPGFSWGLYASSRVQQYGGTAIGCELSMGNLGPGTAEVNPYQGLGNGAGAGLWLSSGSEAYSQGKTVYPASVAIGIVSNGSTWAKGIVFQNNGLLADSNGRMKAIQLPSKAEIQWTFDNTGARSSFIRCDATAANPGIVFESGNFTVLNSAENTNLLQVTNAGVTTVGTFYVLGGNMYIEGAGYPTLQFDHTAGNANQILGTVAGSTRWSLRIGDNDAEGAGNTGSSFSLYRYDNSGNFIDQVFGITRNDGMFRIYGAGGLIIYHNVGFNGTVPIAKPTVTGAKGGNAALASLMTALAAYGLVNDTTT